MVGTAKRQWVKTGDLLRIDLGDGAHSYAAVSTTPLVVFFDYNTLADLPPRDVLGLHVAFRIWVFKSDLSSGRWPRVGKLDMPSEWLEQPVMFKQDKISGALALHHERFAASGFETAATLSECEGLECAAVWAASHVEDRLRDHFAGRENQWVRSLAIDESRVPPSQRL
jgi:hypothetical protein